MEKRLINLWIRIYVNEIGKGITFKIKIQYILVLLTSDTMKLLGSIKSNIINDEIGEITEVLLVHLRLFSSNYLKKPNVHRVSYTFISNKSFGQVLDIKLTKLQISYFSRHLIQSFYIFKYGS